ncbi:MAG: universal stress protein [Actinobacteria bacterium]|nr:universal stress protein [Actinomycetota bacterium]
MSTFIACTDGSDLAERGIATGVKLLARSGDRIVLATAVETVPTGLAAPMTQLGAQPGLPPPLPPTHEQTMIETVLAQGAELLEATAERLDLPDAERRVLDGKPGVMLCALVDELHADALIIAQRGQGALRRALLGSVSSYVVHHASCPVLVVPDSATT